MPRSRSGWEDTLTKEDFLVLGLEMRGDYFELSRGRLVGFVTVEAKQVKFIYQRK